MCLCALTHAVDRTNIILHKHVLNAVIHSDADFTQQMCEDEVPELEVLWKSQLKWPAVAGCYRNGSPPANIATLHATDTSPGIVTALTCCMTKQWSKQDICIGLLNWRISTSLQYLGWYWAIKQFYPCPSLLPSCRSSLDFGQYSLAVLLMAGDLTEPEWPVTYWRGLWSNFADAPIAIIAMPNRYNAIFRLVETRSYDVHHKQSQCAKTILFRDKFVALLKF